MFDTGTTCKHYDRMHATRSDTSCHCFVSVDPLDTVISRRQCQRNTLDSVGQIDVQCWWTIICWRHQTHTGVAFMINSTAQRALISWQPLSSPDNSQPMMRFQFCDKLFENSFCRLSMSVCGSHLAETGHCFKNLNANVLWRRWHTTANELTKL